MSFTLYVIFIYKYIFITIHAQHSTAQHSTAQHGTAWHSTAQVKFNIRQKRGEWGIIKYPISPSPPPTQRTSIESESQVRFAELLSLQYVHNIAEAFNIHSKRHPLPQTSRKLVTLYRPVGKKQSGVFAAAGVDTK